MDANSLVIGLTILFGVLGILGLVITLVALEWTSRDRSQASKWKMTVRCPDAPDQRARTAKTSISAFAVTVHAFDV
jgi:hypothetical protein